MQLRMPNDPLSPYERPYQYLYIHRTTESSNTSAGKFQKQETIGRVWIDPPVDASGKSLKASERIRLELKKTLTEEEKEEVLTMAKAKLPLMDRIWVAANIERIKRELQCLARILPKLSSLPPNARNFDLYESCEMVRDAVASLAEDSHEDVSDVPPEAKPYLDKTSQESPRLMLWAHHDAKQKVPARLLKQILQLAQEFTEDKY